MRPTIYWDENRVVMIDQRKLPAEESYVACRDENEVADAIEKMVIRGAPAIGVAAAFGVALGMMKVEEGAKREQEFDRICRRLKVTRPTARNLFWALERMRAAFEGSRALELPELKKRLIEEAQAIEKEDIAVNRRIGSWGARLVKDGDSILTHCNAGALATAGYGTALGVVRSAFADGKKIRVFVGETRPFLQGARLTCWELEREKIPVVLITDNMAGYLMQKKMISLVITGADRIAQNGDAANKIGTYILAVLAREHEVPFYIAAPLSTVDFQIECGDRIPIEERDPQEVREFAEKCLAPERIDVMNPAFDITPARYISAIITERGIARPPYRESLERLMKG
ncbi:MAG: S-methyl-5-thioribose-1-phosphate isomerase [Candidatus Aminicenantales bacterium]